MKNVRDRATAAERGNRGTLACYDAGSLMFDQNLRAQARSGVRIRSRRLDALHGLEVEATSRDIGVGAAFT